MTTILFALLVLINGVSQTDQQETANKDFSEANASYAELIEKIKQSASSDDIEEIRKVYVATEYYNPYGVDDSDIEKSMFEGMKDEDWEKCLENATKILDNNYISLDAHYGAMVCANESGNNTKGEFHRKVLRGLIDAIRKTGDGKSEDSAFFCTSTGEVWSFIGLLGFRANGYNCPRKLDHLLRWIYIGITPQHVEGRFHVEKASSIQRPVQVSGGA